MAKSPSIPHGSAWVQQIFNANAAKNGGIVRRSVSSVNYFASHNTLQREVQRRGFHMVISGDQYVVFCHTGGLDLIC